MGVIRRQGIKNSIFNYAGVGLGYINMAFIMTELLTVEQYGLRGVIFRLGSFFSMAALLGSSNIMNRFFPHFKDPEKRHNHLPSFVLSYVTFGLIFASLLAVVLKPVAMSVYIDKAPLLLDFYYIVIPFGASLALFEALSAYCRVLLKSTVPVFVREVGVRVATTALLGLLALKVIDFDLFFQLYLYTNTAGVLVLILYLSRLGEFHFQPVRVWSFSRAGEMVKFGLYTVFNTAINMVVRMTDLLMLTALSTGLVAAGIYDFGMLIANIINVPAQSLKQIASPIVADAFKRNDMKQLEDIYRKTCNNQLVAGLFVFAVVILNLHSLFQVMKPEFAAAEYVVYIMGAARIVEMASGMNNRIIVESKYYRTTIVYNVVMLALVIVTNWLLIPPYGIEGAAIASALSVFFIIAAKTWFVYRKFGFNPYDINTFKAPVLAVLSVLAIYFLPKSGNVFLDIGYRTALFVPLYAGLVYFTKVSEDVNALIHAVLDRVRKR